MQHLARNPHHSPHDESATPETPGNVLNWARRYDLLLTVLTLGQERAFRQRLIDLVHLQPGEVVLDVGCGTGTLALAAKRRVGAAGRVVGVDPSPQMISRARHKAERRGIAADFQVGVIEALTVPDRTFDVVLSSFMMHHLPDDLMPRGVAEIARVLKPGGRMLVVDFVGPSGPSKRRLQDLPPLMEQKGFHHLEMGEVRLAVVPGLGFVRGSMRQPGEAETD